MRQDQQIHLAAPAAEKVFTANLPGIIHAVDISAVHNNGIVPGADRERLPLSYIQNGDCTRSGGVIDPRGQQREAKRSSRGSGREEHSGASAIFPEKTYRRKQITQNQPGKD